MAAASLASRIGSAASEEPTTLEENLSAWMKTKELNLGLDILSDPCISEAHIMQIVNASPKTMVLAALNIVDRFTPPMLVSAMRSELSVTTLRECITTLGQLFDAYAVLPEADIRKVAPDGPSLGNVVLFTRCLLDAKFLDMCLEGSEEGRKALVEAFRVMEVRIRSLEKDSLAGSKAAALLKGLDSVSRSSLAEVSAAAAGGNYDGFFEKRHLDIPGWGPSSTTTATSPRHKKMWVLAGQSKPSPSVGQTLGPLGINMMQFNKELNARIATVRAKVPVQVTLVPKTDKTYAFWLRTPPANWFIRRVARLPLCGGKGHRNIVGTITLKEVYHIARAKSMDPTNVGKPLRSIVISVIGTARAMGIQVLYKLPVQHQHRDDLPISDLDRLKKETRARGLLDAACWGSAVAIAKLHRIGPSLGRLEVQSIVLKKFVLDLKSPLPLCRGSERVDITTRQGVYVVLHCQFHPLETSSSSTPCCGVGESCPLPLFHPQPCFNSVVETPALPHFVELTIDGLFEACKNAAPENVSLQGALEMALLACICDATGRRPSEILWWYGGGVEEQCKIARSIKINQMYTREERKDGVVSGCVKLKVGEDPIRDAERVNAAAGSINDGLLRLDANQSWTRAEYQLFAGSLTNEAKAKIEYIEEPTVTWEDKSAEVGIPIAMDESLVNVAKFPASEVKDVHFVLKPGVLGFRRACQYVVRYADRCCLSSMFESSLSMYWYTAMAALCRDRVYHGLSTSGRLIEAMAPSYDELIVKDALWSVDVTDCERELRELTLSIVRDDSLLS
ncbi:hypothetical protein FOL46_000447 [Perkinsus olseni]|uniref:Mandelate racemase/muconate lactonizing enzyme C-terminal domain-containing protein n=1 Tax=Perkinsus olseni TaxID=32597 RepID=A0A7J6KWC3_PEROL|nr:hypothetical protein FOL46_000447 [Perkinsus olseni]